MLEAVRARIPTLLLTMEPSYCKLITQHSNLLVYKPDIANTHIPVEIMLARIISNQGRVGTGGLHIPKTSQPWRPTQPITLHHHRAERAEDWGGKKTFLAETKNYIPKHLSLRSPPHMPVPNQFTQFTIPPPFSTRLSWLLGHLVLLVVFLPL